MISSAVFNPINFYYPIGNTPPVCLTQDLPPEQEAEILSLGCGDARNILFTCFADNKRKLDVTCCDIEPMIHARNVLLYTLLIDDEADHNIEQIYDIYYHWKVSEISLHILESQIKKLLQVSSSIDLWHSSVYGSNIRFCDKRSLSLVRCYWLGFTARGLSSQQKEKRLNHLQAAIERAKANRPNIPEGTGYRSTFPTATKEEAWADLCKISQQWWDHGTVPASNTFSTKSMHLNPAFLYSPNNSLTIYSAMSPLGGISLSTAYASIRDESALSKKSNRISSTERLVNCAKGHFRQWASAFRRSAAAGLVIRIFSGDALAFCFTLLGCQVTHSTSVNLFCHSWTCSPLILHHDDYGHRTNGAPTIFDIIDTSNLIDSLGPLNLLALGSRLLKYNASSSLYTEMLVMLDITPVDRLSTLLCADVRCISLFLGLVLPDVFTNTTNCVEDFRGSGVKSKDHLKVLVRQVRSRLRWKRTGGYGTSCFSPPIQVEADELAKLLIGIHSKMFKAEDPLSMDLQDETELKIEVCKLKFRPYNRASFAFLLRILKSNIISDWDKCLKKLFIEISSKKNCEGIKAHYMKEQDLYMKVFGVDSNLLTKPKPEDKNQLSFTEKTFQSKNLPDQLCVTIRVPRAQILFLEKASSSLLINCGFEGMGPNGEHCYHSFSSIQIMFGKWYKQSKDGKAHLFIEEDSAMLQGTSDMHISVLVPTAMLTSFLRQSKHFTPMVRCGLKHDITTIQDFYEKLGPSLWFSSSKIKSGNVFITHFMPGMSEAPTFILNSNHLDIATSDVAIAHLSEDGSKLNSLARRISLGSEAVKSKLAEEAFTVTKKFTTPWTVVVSIAKSLDFHLEFPVPVSSQNPKIKIARKSSYIEIETGILNPLVEDAPACLFPCFLMQTPSGKVPVPWTSKYINLDLMPAIDLDGSEGQYGSWIHAHASEMFSVHENYLRKSNLGFNSRMILKQGLLLLHMVYSGYQGQKRNYFGLRSEKRVHTLFFPSCLRLDLASNTIVLDCALIQLTKVVKKDASVSKFLQEIKRNGAFLICVSETENISWKAMMPAMVERCRTWKHTSDCEYVLAGEVPLSQGLRHDRQSSICSCGIGKFPKDYLEEEMKNFSALEQILDRYGTRIALSPVFAVPHVEDCGTDDPSDDDWSPTCSLNLCHILVFFFLIYYYYF